MAARAHLQISGDYPKDKMDLRFWRKGFDADGEREFQYGDYGQRAVKIRFRVSQWPSPTMKLHRWLRDISRTNGTFLQALPVLIPLVYVTLFEDHMSALLHISFTISASLLRHMALGLLLGILPLYMRKLTATRLFIIICSLLFISSSRTVFPDNVEMPVYTTAILFLLGLTFLLVSFHIEYVFPQSFAGVKVKTIMKDGKPIEPSEALELSWSNSTEGHGKTLLKDLYPNANIPDPLESTIEFGVYKGMSTKDLKALLRTRFWMFDFNDSWPSWVKSPPPGGQFFPLEAITLNPESFEARRDDVKHDEGYLDTDEDLADGDDPDGDVWILPPSQVTPLRLPGIYLAVPRRVCRSYSKRLWKFCTSTVIGTFGLLSSCFKLVESGVAFFSRGWFILFLIATFASQLLAAGSNNASSLGEQASKMGQSWASEAVSILKAPITHMYRNGPVISTALGEFGGWEGKSVDDICKQMLNTQKDIGQAGKDFCNDVVREREDRFANTIICLAAVWVIWKYVYLKK